MNDLKIFKNTEFGELGVLLIDGKPHFPATESARILGYAKPENAIARHCKGSLKRGVLSNGGVQEKKFIPEGDLYRLIARSNLPEAERFERWIFDEVVPSVRKHGAYMTPETIEKALLNPDTIISLATQLKSEQEQRKALEQTVENQKGAVLFASAVETSKSTILIGELAKLIKQNGVDIGQNRLFNWLRNNGYLISRQGSDYNMPTQKSMELDLFTIKETAINHSDGHISVSKTPKVTGKGQQYFIEKFLNPATA